jgi:hypothetical protein
LVDGKKLISSKVPNSNSILLVKCTKDGKILKSTNGGSSWYETKFSPLSEDPSSSAPSPFFLSLASDRNGENLVGASNQGIFRSKDSGETWSLMTSFEAGKELPRKWADITSDALGENIVAISMVDSDATKGSAIYYSNNHGQTWKRSNSLSSFSDWRSVVSDQSGQYVVAASSNKGIYTSLDFGVTWAKAKVLNEGDVGQEIEIMKWEELSTDFTGQYLVAVASNSNRIYHSTDHGLVWDPLEKLASVSGSSLSFSEAYYIKSIISDYSGQYLTACSSDSLLFQSNNYGEDWELYGNPSTESCETLAYNTEGDLMLLLTEVEGTLLTSNDHGVTWKSRFGRVLVGAPDVIDAVAEDGTSEEQLHKSEFSALFSGYKGYHPRIKKGKNQTKQTKPSSASVQQVEKRVSYDFNSLFESYNDNCEFLLIICVFFFLSSFLFSSVFGWESEFFS